MYLSEFSPSLNNISVKNMYRASHPYTANSKGPKVHVKP